MAVLKSQMQKKKPKQCFRGLPYSMWKDIVPHQYLPELCNTHGIILGQSPDPITTTCIYTAIDFSSGALLLHSLLSVTQVEWSELIQSIQVNNAVLLEDFACSHVASVKRRILPVLLVQDNCNSASYSQVCASTSSVT